MFRPPNIHRRKNNLFILNTTLVSKDATLPTKPTKSRFFSVLSEFCARTSIHGVAYLGNRTRYFIERLWWTIAIVSAIILCTFWIYSSWGSNQENSVILRYDRAHQSVKKLPFPAITICPKVKTSVEKFNYTDVYRSLLDLDGNRSRQVTSKEIIRMKAINQLCEKSKAQKDISDLYPDEFIDGTLLEFLVDLAPDFSETFVLCKLFVRWVDCKSMLYPIITENGLCYTFNSLDFNEYLSDDIWLDIKNQTSNPPKSVWSLEGGYNIKSTVEDPYPYRVNGAGILFGVTFILKVNDYDIDYTCSGPVQGFKIIFHTPFELPLAMKNEFELSPETAANYMIVPKLIETSDDAIGYPPNTRQCYYNAERRLRYFKQYTQHNCYLECLSNYTWAQCGCVPFSLLRGRGTKVCGPKKEKCYMRAEKYFFGSDDKTDCNCLPSCVSIAYDAYSSTGDYDLVSAYSKSIFQSNFNLTSAKFSRMMVSFKENTFAVTKRVENRNWNDSIASAGGLISLCIGASILSFVEMLYYLTLRMFVTYRKYRKSNRAKRMILQRNRNTTE